MAVRPPVLLLAFGAAIASAQPTGVALNNLGVKLRLDARPADAILQFNAAVKLAESSGDQRLLAAALGGLGSSLVDQGELARAEPVLRRSLALFEKSAGPDSLETGEAANNLAMLYRKTGELAQAEAQLERALPLMEAHLGPRSPELEIACNNMFIVEAEQRRWDQAGPFLERASAIALALPEDSNRADIEENRALLQAHQAHYRDAAQSMQQAIAIETRILDSKDPRLARSFETYALYLRKSGQKTEARRAGQSARAIRNSSRP